MALPDSALLIRKIFCAQTNPESALLPGQTVVAPTTERAAVMMFIQFAFESMLYVIHVLETVLDEQFAGFL